MRAYMYEILVLIKRDWAYHVHKLELTHNKLNEKGIKCNIKESLFLQTKMECLGFLATHNGMKPINK